jgi:DNA-binding MarR family transcriptional regulator
MQAIPVNVLSMTREVPNLDSWWQELERLARVLGRIGPDEICCDGLTSRQASILRTLAAREGSRLTDLAEAACLSPSAMTRVVEKLEAQGMVQRVRGAQDDGRAGMVRITERGRQVRASIDRLMQERTAAILAAIPAEDRQAVLHCLQRLNQALEATACCCSPARFSGLIRS